MSEPNHDEAEKLEKTERLLAAVLATLEENDLLPILRKLPSVGAWWTLNKKRLWSSR